MFSPRQTRFKFELRRALSSDQIISDPLYRYAFARDAGFYRLLPQLLVKAKSSHDISNIFQLANKFNRTITFRAGGTSLSGQAISDDILVEVKQGWRGIEVLENGRQVKLQPGVVAAKANQSLAPYGYQIGPDPGSIRSALIGGIVANNASGIGSGNHGNSYETLAAMELVLANGLVLNTAEPRDNERLQREAPAIFKKISQIRDTILSQPLLKQKIRGKYKLKNTMGYSLNSFLDYEQPLDILAHLMVGSEGTLGFISSVTLNTFPLKKYKSTALLLFGTLTDAAGMVPKLKKLGSFALEIMDDAAIRATQHIPGLPDQITHHIKEGSAALLVEYQATERDTLRDRVKSVRKLMAAKHPEVEVTFFEDTAQREKLWKVRRELGPLHAATRPAGTTVLSEDVCFKVKDLSRAIKDLKFLFKHYHYDDAVIFGHAGDGNLHFKLSLDFSYKPAIQEYGEFMLDLVELVVDKYDGSLKAEHGTGRNMAAFVEREWGAEAYTIMEDIKQILDPTGILNPGVVLSNDKSIHLKNIKSIPLVDPLIDRCIECGLCEPWCPSADLTLTPRQRITVLREIESLDLAGGQEKLIQKLENGFKYAGLETCATDGLCGLSCPVDIDTGLLVKQMRGDDQRSLSHWLAGLLRKYFSVTSVSLRVLVRLLTPLRFALTSNALASGFKKLVGFSKGRIPAINPHLQAASGELPTGQLSPDVIYFPSCLNRVLADPSQTKLSVSQAFLEVLNYAGINVGYPDKVADLCCGLSFSSKGFEVSALEAAIQTTEILWISSLGGKLPIVMDTSPCSNHLNNYDKLLSGLHLARWRNLTILDMIEYVHDAVMSKLDLHEVKNKVVLHPTCSTRKMGQVTKMETIANQCAREVQIPVDLGCCAFAGDRGLMVPELTDSATRSEAVEVNHIDADGHYSTSRTCEVGMSQATDQSYQSLIYLVHEALFSPKA